jgi:acyl-CoA thioester hydrolase
LRWHECDEKVRFCEVDSFDVVWHGHYIKYFEIGRLDLSGKFGMSPDKMRKMGYYAPVVDLRCRFREPARLGDMITIKTSVDPVEKAALTFRYEVIRTHDDVILAEGFTSHVLLTLDGTMIYMIPEKLKKPLEDMLAYCND